MIVEVLVEVLGKGMVLVKILREVLDLFEVLVLTKVLLVEVCLLV